MKFFCTAGRGTETFLAEEIHSIWENAEVTVTDGKVYFIAPSPTSDTPKILNLRTAERVFVNVLHRGTKSLDRTALLKILRGDLVDKQLLLGCIQIWRRVLGHSISRPLTNGSHDPRHPDCEEHDGQCSAAKRVRLDADEGVISFRVSCKVSGSVRRKLNPQMTSRQVGIAVSKLMGWNLDLRHPQLEICIHVSEENLIVGIPLTSIPVSKRTFIRHCGLRAPVACIMVHLLHIQPGDVVLDPMCGKATILLEALHSHGDAVYMASDLDSQQLWLARENLLFAKAESRIHLLQANCTGLPLKSETVDKIVTDAPFGQKFTIQSDIQHFYVAILQEFHRILKPGGCVVLLTSQELQLYISQVLPGVTSLDNVCAVNQMDKEGLARQSREQTQSLENNTDSQQTQNHSEINNTDKHVLNSSTQNGAFPSDSVEQKYENLCGDSCSRTLDINNTNTCSSYQTDFVLKESHYVKLGETHAYICVIIKKGK